MSKVQKHYTNPHLIGSFSGLPFFEKTKYNKDLNKKELRKELEKVDALNLFRPIRLHPPARKTLVFFPNYTWGIDLISRNQNTTKIQTIFYCVLICFQDLYFFISLRRRIQ